MNRSLNSMWCLRLRNGRILPRSGRFVARTEPAEKFGFGYDADAVCPVWTAYLKQFENLDVSALRRFFRNCAVPQRRQSRLLVVVSNDQRGFELGFTPAESVLRHLLISMFSSLTPHESAVSPTIDSSSLTATYSRPIAVLRQLPGTVKTARRLARSVDSCPSRCVLFTRRTPIDWKMPIHDVADFRTKRSVFYVSVAELADERAGILNWALGRSG